MRCVCLMAAVLVTVSACSEGSIDSHLTMASPRVSAVSVSEGHGGHIVPAGSALTLQELARLRNATARYHDHEAAVADGYTALLNVNGDEYVPGMGYHYANPAFLDGTFDPDRPEVLLYAPDSRGKLKLLGVEFATVIPDLSKPPAAPSGFSGDADAWAINQQFSVWTLHVWVWLDNPAGVFQPYNERLP